MLVRRNVSSLSQDDFNTYVSGVKKLKSAGTYDQYVKNHWTASEVLSVYPQTRSWSGDNAGHGGPAFLPWHREFLTLFERDMQNALKKSSYALPYWDWTDTTHNLFTPALMGGAGSPLQTGPFVASQWPVTVVPSGAPGYLVRSLSYLSRTLPSQADVNSALQLSTYDTAPWNQTSVGSFRATLEGWTTVNGNPPPNLHNLVHMWVGGSMIPMTSPNDPVFWLHHANIDKIWAIWQGMYPSATFQPASGGPPGHNLNDRMWPWDVGPLIVTPANVLDHFALGYVYDFEWLPMATGLPSGGLQQIAAGSKSQIWGIDTQNAIWRWSGTTWTQPPPSSARAVSISASKDGTVLIVGVGPGNVFQYTGSGWDNVSSNISEAMVQVDSQQKGVVWALQQGGEYLWQWSNKIWTGWPNYLNTAQTPRLTLAAIAVGSDGTRFALDASNNVLTMVTGRPGYWATLGGVLSAIGAADKNHLWGVNQGQMYNNINNAGWQPVAPLNFIPSMVSVASDGTQVALDSAGKIYRSQTSPT